MMYQVTDENGNSFFTKDYDLALKIIKDKTNPFINLFETKEKVDGKHIIKTIEDFENYFY